MPNRNGQGPENTGPQTGRRRGLCHANSMDATPQEAPQTQVNDQDCRGPRGCGTGKRSGSGRAGCGQGRRGGGRQG